MLASHLSVLVDNFVHFLGSIFQKGCGQLNVVSRDDDRHLRRRGRKMPAPNERARCQRGEGRRRREKPRVGKDRCLASPELGNINKATRMCLAHMRAVSPAKRPMVGSSDTSVDVLA